MIGLILVWVSFLALGMIIYGFGYHFGYSRGAEDESDRIANHTYRIRKRFEGRLDELP